MFSFRKSSAASPQSSLSSGHASIQRCQSISPPEHYDEYVEHEDTIDLQTSDTNESLEDLTIESMSAVIAAAVQISSAGGQPSSLSLGSASILQPFSKLEKNKGRFSLFQWKKAPASTSSSPPTSPQMPGLDYSSSISSQPEEEDTHTPRNSSCQIDDGRDELIYRGIQIKEVKTTLKTLVIPDQVSNPMPKVQLERPSFARVSY